MTFTFLPSMLRNLSNCVVHSRLLVQRAAVTLTVLFMATIRWLQKILNALQQPSSTLLRPHNEVLSLYRITSVGTCHEPTENTQSVVQPAERRRDVCFYRCCGHCVGIKAKLSVLCRVWEDSITVLLCSMTRFGTKLRQNAAEVSIPLPTFMLPIISPSCVIGWLWVVSC